MVEVVINTDPRVLTPAEQIVADAEFNASWFAPNYPDDADIVLARTKAIDAIKITRDTHLEGDFTWTYLAVDYVIQGRDKDLTNMERSRDFLIESIARGTPVGQAKQPWRITNNSSTPDLMPADINDMAYVKGQQIAVIWANFRLLETDIADAVDIPEIRLIDLTDGWPT